ncbi:hypothetical protein [Phenylobacterium sp.]|uniref:hypothetical protein n=1 Tax=Phenylobacterium sp. TaxID=1871053 RepID=UPI00120F8218|nr:hypothetical protein [Phenylobacterium sp.]THD57242.1 MAG: hypothetical protein E8A12_13750 [Phenylobacterium sp.]
MANHPQRADHEPQPSGRLTDALNAKLAELRGRGLAPQWIEANVEALTRLMLESGEAAIRLDPDPAADRAWYGKVEIRHAAARDQLWIIVTGEVAAGEVSAHVVALPDAPV